MNNMNTSNGVNANSNNILPLNPAALPAVYTVSRIPELETISIADAMVCIHNYLRKHTYLLDTLPEQIAMHYAQAQVEHCYYRSNPEVISKLCKGNALKARGKRLTEDLTLGLREMLDVVTEEYCNIVFSIYTQRGCTLLDAKLMALLHCIWPREWRHCG